MKQHLSYNQQVSRLQEHGIIIVDEEETLQCLKQINYYRLRGYWLSFEENGQIIEGTTFNQISNLYKFDSTLRSLLLQIIEPIEVKLRTQIAYYLSEQAGPSAHKNPCMFKDLTEYSKFLENLQRETTRAIRSKIPCVIHNLNNYGDLPIWSAIELLSLGSISSMYGNLNDTISSGNTKSCKNLIAAEFGTSSHYLQSWTHHLTGIRNICAHQDKFYGHLVKIKPTLFQDDRAYPNESQFATMLVLKRICDNNLEIHWNQFLNELINLTNQFNDVSLTPMGFPENWEEVLER